MDIERRRQLAESLQEVLNTPLRRQDDPELVARLRREEARRRRQRPLLVCAIGGWIALAWLWTARPAMIFDPLGARAPTLDPATAEASLRYGLYLQASRIHEFQAEHGRLPTTLDEAGHVEEGVTWQGAGTEWTLRGRVGDLVLQLTSRMAVDSFLGSALEQLRR